MTKTTKSDGQLLVEEIAAWLRGYMSLRNADDALVLAIWAVGTWAFYLFQCYPYLIVTKGQPGCGASVLLRLMARICFRSERTIGSDAALRAILGESVDTNVADNSTGLLTLVCDEAEVLNTSSKNAMSQFMNVGSYRGDTISRNIGGKVVRYPAYCPKLFGMIGGSAATIVDRAIVTVLVKAQPPKQVISWIADEEGNQLAIKIKAALQGIKREAIQPVMADHLIARDQEMWSPMFGMAQALKLDDQTVAKLVTWSADNCEWKKGGENLRNLVIKVADTKDQEYAGRALADLISVLKTNESGIFTAEAVERMRGIPTGPWRTFRGDGLDTLTLSKLLATAGVVRTNKGGIVKLSGKTLAGYKVADLKAAKR